eukprot:3378403-Amphidinium_carterae.1
MLVSQLDKLPAIGATVTGKVQPDFNGGPKVVIPTSPSQKLWPNKAGRNQQCIVKNRTEYI